MDQIGGAFAALLGISQLLYLAVVLTLGVRLMRLAIRTRQLPESLLATHFLACCGAGYVLSIVGLSAARDPGTLPAAVVTGTIALGHLGSCVGVFAGICFNFAVFRRNELWAKALVALAAVAMAAGYAGYGMTGGFAHGRFEGVWLWLFYGTFAWGAAWVMIEPLRYWVVMRRRLQLGLAEPLVVNRFLLWGVGSLCRFSMVVAGLIPAALYSDMKTGVQPGAIGFSLIAIAVAGLGVAVSYWLTFFPTRGYVRFIQRRHGPVAG